MTRKRTRTRRTSFGQAGFGHGSDSQAVAALFALGALRGEEEAAFEKHVSSGCSVCEQELADAAGVVEGLAFASTPAIPSETVRQRLMHALSESHPKTKGARPELVQTDASGILLEEPGLLIARSAKIPWELVAPGISRKTLSIDPGRLYSTCLLRAEPGARYPRHRHGGVEELLVLEGDLHVHGVVMRAGDYCRAEAGSIHDVTFTEGGCVLLQVASQLDQFEA
jgi:anti-sigma factor ChrR (cupin superfamily)